MKENKPIEVNEEWFLEMIRNEVSEPNEALKKAVDKYMSNIIKLQEKEESQ
jgi:uncharacterized protein YifE (UPF0438 family)